MEIHEIHKPKPWHSFREFLKEYGIIVLGVLTALALEQLVESVHEQILRREARQAIEGEISENLDAFRRRAEIQPCIDARLREIETLLTSTPLGANLPRPLWVGRPQVWTINENRLQAATSGARTALLSAREQADYGEVYNGFHVLDAAQNVEQLAWARLRTLETLSSLDSQTRWSLTEALHQARYANFRIVIAGANSRDHAKAVGVRTERSPYGEGSRSVCVPMNTPRDQALKMTVIGRSPIAEP